MSLTKNRKTSVEVYSGAATWTSRWVKLETPRSVLVYMLAWTAVAATAGTLTIEVTNDPDGGALNTLALDNAQLTWLGTGFAPSTTAGLSLIVLENLPRYVRMKYTRSAGGGADQFSLRTFGGE